MRFWKSAFALGISSVTLMVAYQNCAQSPGVETGSQHVDVEIDYPVYALGTEESTSAKVDSRNCELQRLHCLRKVYSPAVEDLQTEEIHCLDETAAQHCLKVNSVYYNTSFAIQTCGDCTAEDAKHGGQYNREEVTCWLGAPASGPEAVFALRSNFHEAAMAVLASCSGGT